MSKDSINTKWECLAAASEITKEYAKGPSVVTEDIVNCLDKTYKKLKELLKDAKDTNA